MKYLFFLLLTLIPTNSLVGNIKIIRPDIASEKMISIAKNVNTTDLGDPIITYNDYVEANSWKVDDLFLGIIWTKQHEDINDKKIPFVMTWDTGVKKDNEIGFLCGEIDEIQKQINLHKMIINPNKSQMYVMIFGEFIDAIRENITTLGMSLNTSDLDIRAKLALMYEINNSSHL